MRLLKFSVIIIAASLLGACATIPVEKRAGLREEINQNAEKTITQLISNNPELQESIDTSVGYFVGQTSGAKIPVVGARSGLGMLYDRKADTRTYMNIKRYDVGVGLGAGKYRGIILFQNREVFEQFRAGIWKSKIGVESAVGEKATTTVSVVDEGATLHLLSETGVVVTASAHLVSLSINEDLTDAGVSSIGLPNTGFTVVDRQGEDAPRIWDHKLPFLAQKVIDKGYDLPLPYGIGLTYVKVDQDILLDNLEVGINGREEEPFEFVAFGNPSAANDTVQLKFDTWLFPFMNVFALLGKIDGKAPMDIILDGNGMLDHLDITCPNPLCPILQDKTLTVPIETKFSGKTYGIGTVLAGGWNNWFVTLPISLNYADMDGKDTAGIAITFTPRFGRVLNLKNKGNLALFAGGNYLKTDLTVSGTVSTPEENLIIDYTIDQINKDRWNLLLGYNWDINKRWSWTLEYDGFIGSREAFITSVTRRF